MTSLPPLPAYDRLQTALQVLLSARTVRVMRLLRLARRRSSDPSRGRDANASVDRPGKLLRCCTCPPDAMSRRTKSKNFEIVICDTRRARLRAPRRRRCRGRGRFVLACAWG